MKKISNTTFNFSVQKNPTDYLQEIPAKCKVLRKQAGYSQTEFANRSGVSLGSIKRFEATGQISLEALLKLMHLLNRLDDMALILNTNDHLDRIEKLFNKKTKA
jgi:transcriptional regulator with XRE-family HTH domain